MQWSFLLQWSSFWSGVGFNLISNQTYFRNSIEGWIMDSEDTWHCAWVHDICTSIVMLVPSFSFFDIHILFYFVLFYFYFILFYFISFDFFNLLFPFNVALIIQWNHRKNMGQTKWFTHTQTDSHIHSDVYRVSSQLKKNIHAFIHTDINACIHTYIHTYMINQWVANIRFCFLMTLSVSFLPSNRVCGKVIYITVTTSVW